MAQIKIFGSSDDLICIEGDISEEFNHYEPEHVYIFVSDGTVLSASYGQRNNGFWRFAPIHKGTAKYEKEEATGEEGEYSDVVTLTGDIHWVGFGQELAK
jgi:hypothetical protein